MSADEVATFVNRLEEAARPADAEQLAQALVAVGHLTAYQAKEINHGRERELVLGNYVILGKLVVCLTQKVSYREPHERGELFRGEGRLAWSR
jgi:hypothetical protein